MMSEERLNNLLSAWQEQQRQGRDVPAAELCRDHPELRRELERRIQAVRQMNDLAGREAETLPAPVPSSGDTTLAPGSRLAAPKEDGLSIPGYEVLGTLGRGGMGVVYQARQTKLGRIVALKMILSGAHAAEADLARFRTEAEAIARLQHPNIVQIHEIGEHGGLPFFSLEFCGGGSLEKKLNATPLPSRGAAAMVAVLARAMQAAHEKGVIHRDLKPANVLLAEDGTPKITDFGLAKKLDEASQTATGAVMGTPSYMAPEQAGGKSKAFGPACDIYALGAVLYECLTGRPPFRAATAMDTLLQVVSEDPAPPRLLNPNVGRDLETICLKCLEKDPRRRYESARALAEDLERYLAGESISARSLNLVNRIASSLEHSHYDVHFRAYSTIIFALAGIMFLTEAGKFLALRTGQTWLVVSVIEAGRVGSVLALLLWLRPSGLRPTSAAERLMWTVWIGYILTLYVLGFSHWIMAGGWVASQDFELYPPIAAVTALAFFVLGCSYWGWCYAFGLAFHVLALLMTIELGWAPLEFGALWAAILMVIGLRLRRLRAAERPPETATNARASWAPQAVTATTGMRTGPEAGGRIGGGAAS
jgi:serine/threonine-protein kinase